jgi:hypothetical protein
MWSWVTKSTAYLLGGLLLTSCGYTLNHRLKDNFISASGESKGIFIPVFDNKTEQTGAEIIFTNALIRELESHSEVVVSNRQAGSLILQGIVTKIDVVPTANSDLGFKGLQFYRRIPSELGIRVNISFTLVDAATNRSLWGKEISGFRRVSGLVSRTYDYQAPSAVGPITQSIIESTFPDIARLIMRDMYDEMVLLFEG